MPAVDSVNQKHVYLTSESADYCTEVRTLSGGITDKEPTS